MARDRNRRVSSAKEYQRLRDARKSTGQMRCKQAARREIVGTVVRKKSLKCSLLNVDGYTPGSYEDVKDALDRKKSDVYPAGDQEERGRNR